MVLYVLIAAITVVLACRVQTTEKAQGEILMGYTTRQRAKSALCLVSVFVILTALAALRHEVGND